MAVLYLILLATIMAIFGVIGYLRGTRPGLLTTALVLVGLLALANAFGAVAKIVNGLNYGVRFALAGGVQALGGSGDKVAAIKGVTDGMGSVKPLMTETQPGLGVALVLGALLVLALLVGLTKSFRERSSITGLALGLLNGYMITTNLLAAVWPKTAFMPTFFEIGAKGASSSSSTAAFAGGDNVDFAQQIADIAADLAGSSILPIAIILLIALVVIMATRQGKSGSKG